MNKALRLVLMLSIFFLSATIVRAEWYRWVDDKGVLHITDDLGKIPEKQRPGARVFETTSPEEAPAAPATAPSAGERTGEGYFGGQPLQWWEDSIKEKKDTVGALESSIASKKQFIGIFEGGRRFGKTFSQEDIDTYNAYKEDLSGEEQRLAEQKAELEDLLNRAKNAGVPAEYL